ncbi:hypothetical protein [Macrococcus armenti]|uniref:hypothetical protein n=1 Tax=Macrococcus armenti TaxID=2875764 RepID=UPI001CCADE5F|nr:hypothetical protein [Macrococcus armenti]UBH14590.1 hypothetical protein LAU44_07350 [Macrococcus armenti]UBH16951.1 hypothetical protein LAU39_07375 [Macrococcus armenti]UBH19214.1 hypothetical protein LAU40_07355 [Macrococcus armenti]
MGLDMYFYVEEMSTKELIEFAYYRKFNALHGYFDKKYKLDNPGRCEVTEFDLHYLLNAVREIHSNPERAPKILPYYTGPFFGTYEYGDIYFEYMFQLHRDLKRLITLDRSKYRIIYQADY